MYGSTTASDTDSSESSSEALLLASENEQERDKSTNFRQNSRTSFVHCPGHMTYFCSTDDTNIDHAPDCGTSRQEG